MPESPFFRGLIPVGGPAATPIEIGRFRIGFDIDHPFKERGS